MTESPDTNKDGGQDSFGTEGEEPVMLVFSISQCQSLAELTNRFRAHIRHLPTRKSAADTPTTGSPASIPKENKIPENN